MYTPLVDQQAAYGVLSRHKGKWLCSFRRSIVAKANRSKQITCDDVLLMVDNFMLGLDEW